MMIVSVGRDTKYVGKELFPSVNPYYRSAIFALETIAVNLLPNILA